MKRRIILLLAFLLISNVGFSQSSTIDSLIQLAKITGRGEEKCNLYNQIAYRLLYNQPEKAIIYAKKAFQLAINSNYKLGQIESYYVQGVAHQMLNNYQEAADKLYASLLLQKELKNKNLQNLLIDTYNSLASISKITGNYDLALEYSFNALNLINENDIVAMISAYNRIGGIYKYMENYNESLNYYNKCIKILEKSDKENLLNIIYNNIGIVYKRLNLLENALDYYQKSLQISINLGDSSLVAITYLNIAEILLQKSNLDSVLYYLDKSFATIRHSQDKRTKIEIFYNYAEYYRQVKNYVKSLEYAQKGLLIAKELNIPNKIQKGYEKLKDIYLSKGDYKETFNYQVKYSQIKDSTLNIEKYLRIAQLESLHKNEYQHIKNIMKEQKKTFVHYIILSVLVTLLIILLLIYLNLKLKFKQNKLNKLQLEIEKEKLITEINDSNRDLAKYLVNLTEKNELILDLKKKLQKLQYSVKGENKPKIQSAINDINASIDTQIWDEFEVRFNAVHKDFYSKFYIKHPDLTQNEKRLVAFLKLNMSTKEISMITKQSVHSIGVARTRLRKKLNLSNTDISLYSYLDQF